LAQNPPLSQTILELCGKMPKPLAEENKSEKVTLDELMVSTLAMSRCVSEADDLPSGIITDDEFKS
jgi:hypothetical protein